MSKDFLSNYIISKMGEYATASKISNVMGMSLSYVYALVRNEKIRRKKKFNRAEYNVMDLLEVLDFSSNELIIENALSKEEKYVNNFYNWIPKNDFEKIIEDLIIDQLGEFTSIKELVKFFKISKTIWYDVLDAGEIMEFSISKRRVIITRSLIPFLRDRKNI